MSTRTNHYVQLGRSGLRVSPFCLGTMTFGTDWGWGAAKETTFAILDRYLESGGNFIDTADGYTNGTSEEFIGEYFEQSKRRDRVVLATKYSFNAIAGDPNAGGNGRKNLYRALEGSLKRLRTDYVDLYWLHAWDGITPVEEVLSTMDTLVRSGRIRYYGFSDVPAWYLARAHTIAELRGTERPCALQLEYSLIERNIEREHIPAAHEFGLGLLPWSPLGSGMLTGKYRRNGTTPVGSGRLTTVQNSGNPSFEKLFNERNWQIAEGLVSIAAEMGKTAAQVALNWVATQPAVASTIISATRVEQLDDNMASLDFEIPGAYRARLDEISRPPTVHPYFFFEPTMRGMIDGGTTILPWSPSRTG